MLFNSFAFLIFIPFFFLFYFLTRGTLRLITCLTASYIFYAWWDWRFLSLIILVTYVNYIAGLKIYKCTNKTGKKNILTLAIIFNLSLLGVFKYFNFFSESFSVLLLKLGMTPSFSTLNIILPVGISFYTFQTMGYLFDIYKNKIECEPSIIRFATFIALFPKLVAGPIVRASGLLHQLSKDQIYTSKSFFDGFRTVLYGYFIKTVIADSIAPIVNLIYSQAETGSSLTLLIGVFLFSFQIYCDFHGYSLIAIGLGKMMGFDFGVNFNRPYLSTNFSEFWKRWHISLSSWLRDYLYIPLGGNRKGVLTTCRNLMITMFLCGLWHGASWTFVIWGVLHGGYILAQNMIQKIISSLNLPQIKMFVLPIKISSILLVFTLTTFAWIFFRAPNLDLAFVIINRIITFDNFDIYLIPEKFIVIKCFILISMLITVEVINSFNKNLLNNPAALYLSIPIILWGIALLGTFAGTSFIYIQF